LALGRGAASHYLGRRRVRGIGGKRGEPGAQPCAQGAAVVVSITEPITRRLTQLFQTRFTRLAFERYAVPENNEFDLLCYVKIIEKVVADQESLTRCLSGEDLDAPWTALADELDKATGKG